MLNLFFNHSYHAKTVESIQYIEHETFNLLVSLRFYPKLKFIKKSIY
jgi:hypothetical protein